MYLSECSCTSRDVIATQWLAHYGMYISAVTHQDQRRAQPAAELYGAFARSTVLFGASRIGSLKPTKAKSPEYEVSFGGL